MAVRKMRIRARTRTAIEIAGAAIRRLNFRRPIRNPQNPVRISFVDIQGRKSGWAQGRSEQFLERLKRKRLADCFRTNITGFGIEPDSYDEDISGSDLIVVTKWHGNFASRIPKGKPILYLGELEEDKQLSGRILRQVYARFRLRRS